MTFPVVRNYYRQTIAMTNSKPKKHRPSPGRVETNTQPPHRGHGSTHTAPKRGSEVPQDPLRGSSLASGMRERLERNGARNAVEQMAQNSLAIDDAKRLAEASRIALEKAHQRRARDDESRALSLSQFDRELIAKMTLALDNCTETLREFLAQESAGESGLTAHSEQDEVSADGFLSPDEMATMREGISIGEEGSDP